MRDFIRPICFVALSAMTLAGQDQIRLIISRDQAQTQVELKQIGFDETTQDRFWVARKKDITSASQPEWRPLILACLDHKDPRLHAWALARLVEAGELDRVEEYSAFMGAQLESFKTGDPDWRHATLNGPPTLPGTQQIAQESPYWVYFGKALLSERDPAALMRLYAVWCWNASMRDKDLVLELASRLAPATETSGHEVSPWSDPRFWMVMDWLCEFGAREDWGAVLARLPKGSQASNAAADLQASLSEYPAFWGAGCEIATPALSLRVHPVIKYSRRYFKDDWVEKLNPRGRFSFTVCTDHKGETSRCRPWPSPWVAAATPSCVKQISSWVSVYPGLDRDKWPQAYQTVTEIVLK